MKFFILIGLKPINNLLSIEIFCAKSGSEKEFISMVKYRK